jgi:hypothetical protein
MTWVIIAVVLYAVVHAGHGVSNARRGRARGLRPRAYIGLGMRGPWVGLGISRRL